MKFIVAIFILVPQFVFAQLELYRPKSPTEIVNKYLFGYNKNITSTNIRFKGSPYAVAVFKNPSNRALFEEGIVFSTGYAEAIKGPNNSPQMSGVVMTPGDAELSKIARTPTLDACVLEFDFKADFDSISFDYFFGSEEYPEYVNKGVNDVFAFLLSEQTNRNYTNLAYLPNNRGPITVDNINADKNSEYFIANQPFNSKPVLDWEGDEEQGELAYTYQFDGFTQVLSAQAKITPGIWYHMKIAIADAGDEVYDSGVFIKTGSFKTYKSIAMLKAQAIDVKQFMAFNPSDIKTNPSGSVTLITHIQFDFDKATIKSESITDLKKVLAIIQANPNYKLNITGHTDDEGDESYNQTLSEKRAEQVAAYFIEQGVEKSLISHQGLGETMPLINETTPEARAQNRRVEFEFFK